MNVYIACHDAEEARMIASSITEWGYKITSTWHVLEKSILGSKGFSTAQKRAIAMRDIKDILKSDILILVSGEQKYSGGKFVETGFAYGIGIPVIVYGSYENVMVSIFPRASRKNDLQHALDYASEGRLKDIYKMEDE